MHEDYQFFFATLHEITDSFPSVFKGGGGSRPHSKEYRDFGERWGFQKVLYEMADEEITKVAEIYQIHLNDFLTFLTYRIQKGEMEEVEDKFQQTLRDAKRKR